MDDKFISERLDDKILSNIMNSLMKECSMYQEYAFVPDLVNSIKDDLNGKELFGLAPILSSENVRLYSSAQETFSFVNSLDSTQSLYKKHTDDFEYFILDYAPDFVETLGTVTPRHAVVVREATDALIREFNDIGILSRLDPALSKMLIYDMFPDRRDNESVDALSYLRDNNFGAFYKGLYEYLPESKLSFLEGVMETLTSRHAIENLAEQSLEGVSSMNKEGISLFLNDALMYSTDYELSNKLFHSPAVSNSSKEVFIRSGSLYFNLKKNLLDNYPSPVNNIFSMEIYKYSILSAFGYREKLDQGVVPGSTELVLGKIRNHLSKKEGAFNFLWKANQEKLANEYISMTGKDSLEVNHKTEYLKVKKRITLPEKGSEKRGRGV